jgi:tetratricopeptide (TPR) repeat protein
VNRGILAIIILLACGACGRTPQQKAARFLESGKMHFQKGDYPRAILQFKNAAQADPSNAEIFYQAALTYIALGDINSAAGNLRRAIDLDPKHAAALSKLADLMSYGSRSKKGWEEARKHAEEAVKLAGPNVEALNALALAELRLGQPDLAEKHLQEALQNFPRSLKAAAAVAGFRVARGDQRGAEKVLRDAVSADPKSAEARITLAEFYRGQHRPEAEEEFRAALQLDPKSGIAMLGISAIQEAQGRKDLAEQTLRQISALPDARYKPLHALFQYQNGKVDEAIVEFEAMLRRDPKDRSNRTRLIAMYLSVGRSAQAEQTINAALKSNPKDGDALLQRSEIFVREGRYKEAQQDLTKLLILRPASAEVHYGLARVHRARGASLQEGQELGEALKQDPKLIGARLALAAKLTSEKSARAALNLLDEAPASQKSNISFIVQRNWTLWALGDRTELRKGVAQGLSIARTPDLLLQDGLLKTQDKNISEAQMSFQEAISRAPEDLRTIDALAGSLIAQKQVAKGVAQLHKYAEDRPKSPQAQQLLGDWLYRTGDPAGARAAFEAAKRADPTYTTADLALARLDMQESKAEAARSRLSKLLTWKPDDLRAQAAGLSAHVLLGNLDQASGDFAKAMEHYRRVVEMDSQNVMALNNLAYLLADYANQPDEAMLYAQRAKDLDPKSPDVADTLGWALYRKGIYQSAVQGLEAAGADGSPRLKYHLAMAYLKAGDSTKGRQVLQEALRLDPSLPEARMARNVLDEASRVAR